jgi:hypothetical protein
VAIVQISMKLELKSKTALDLAIELAQQFHHNDHGWIYAVNQAKPNWITRTDHQLSTGELVREYLDIERLIGVGFDKTTKYAVIDLDWSSQYHPAHNIDAYFKILHTLESIGLTRYVVIQSSYSRGLHIYFPLSHPVKTFELAAAIRVALIKAGFQPKNGQLEIFPNTKRYASASGDYSHYNLHRMPLLPNSGSWLMEDDGLSPQPLFDGLESQLSAFLAQWEMAAAGQDLELLARALPKLYETFKKSKRKYQPQSDEDKSVKAAKWEADLKLTIQIGWTDRGQTYILMPKFLAYGVVFLKLTGQALYDWMYQAIINAIGYQKYCQHQHEIEKMIRSWIRTNERTQYYRPYHSEPDRNQPFPFGDPKLKAKVAKPRQPHPANIKRAQSAIHRIKTGYAVVREQFNSKTTIGQMKEQIRAEIERIFSVTCSDSTLNKHKNIWHPEHNNQDWYTPNNLEDKSLETSVDNRSSDWIEKTETEVKTVQTDTQQGLVQSQIPMICTSDVPQGKINTPPHPRPNHYSQKDVIPKPGKFEMLAGALGKIAALAALVVGIVSAVGIDKEPTVAVAITPDLIVLGVEEIAPIPVAPTQNEAEDLPLRPCDDPRISPMYFVQYNPNQIGVPWNTAAEFHKFLGYLFIVAKIDKTIQNPWAWAVKSIKNIKERGINSHWLTFTGQQMLDPNSPQMQQLRTIFPQTNPAPANVTIARPNESIANIVQRVDPQPDKPEPTLSSPPDPTQNVTPRAYQPQQHTSGDICPECSTATPTVELERWQMCRFCAQKILWRRLV